MLEIFPYFTEITNTWFRRREIFLLNLPQSHLQPSTHPNGLCCSKISTNWTCARTTTCPSHTVLPRWNVISPTTSSQGSSAWTSRPTRARTRWWPGSSASWGWRRRGTRARWIRRWPDAWSCASTGPHVSSNPNRVRVKNTWWYTGNCF